MCIVAASHRNVASKMNNKLGDFLGISWGIFCGILNSDFVIVEFLKIGDFVIVFF